MVEQWIENSPGIAEYLASDPELYASLLERAERAAAYARSIAPIGRAVDGDKHPGAYRDSIKVERNPEGIGVRLLSDDNKAHWIEYGAAHMRKYRVLGQAIEHAG